MIKWCTEWRLPEPDFEYTGTSLVVTFRKSKLTEEYLESLNLNERQMKALEFLKEHKRITSKKYADLFGIIDRNNSFILEENAGIKSILLNKDDT